MNERIYYDECPICSGNIKNWAFKNKFNISKCRFCSFVFVNPRPAIESLEQFYSELENESNSLEEAFKREKEYPNATIDARRIISTISLYLENIKKSSLALLDVGCGYGFFSKEAICQGFNVTGLEIAENERAIYTNFIGKTPVLSTFENFSSDSSYDAILMSQVLEHANNINLWITKAYEMLNSEGILAIAVPNFNSFLRYALRENDPYINPPEHLNFFNKKSLMILLNKHGFKVLRTHCVSRIEKSIISKQLCINGLLLDTIEMFLSIFLLRILDTSGYGMILNIYCKKE